MTRESYREYLKSDHWKNLRARKRKSSMRKGKQPRCAVCGAVEDLQTHHLNYRGLYDVELSDLRILCSRCHTTVHDLIREGVLVPAQYQNHHALFAATKHRVKVRLGLASLNMFRGS